MNMLMGNGFSMGLTMTRLCSLATSLRLLSTIVAKTIEKVERTSPTPTLSMADDPVNVNVFEEVARQALPKMNYDYIRGGDEDEYTLRQNVEAFQRIRFRPRVPIDVSSINLSTTILGYKTLAPIMIGPTGGQILAHPEGEVATARGAAASNTIMVPSFFSSYTIEEVASSCEAIRFYQLYIFKQREVSTTLVQRAERNGFKAIILTVPS